MPHFRFRANPTHPPDPLLHAARQVMRVAAGELLELHQRELAQRDGLALVLRHALHLEPERHVAERGTPGKQLGEILEHHAAVHAVAGDRLAVDADLARGRRNEARDDVEEGRLAAAARADDADEFGRRDIEAHRVDGVHAPGGRVVEE
jgi:hypothetical protein